MHQDNFLENFPIEAIKEWFLLNKRDFPWRQNPTPYRVWISEIMLQQTQAAVVISYFEKWMQTHFPCIHFERYAYDIVCTVELNPGWK